MTDNLAEISAIEWSPEGSQVAMVHALLGRGAISIVDATGKEPIRTLDLGDVQPFNWLAWRPEAGGTLYFNGEPQVAERMIGIFAIGQDGVGVRSVAPPLPNDGNYNHPSISADGARLTYWNFEPSVLDGRTDGWSHVLDLATGEDRQVRFGNADADIQGQFSPDGSRFLFESQRILPDEDFDRQVVMSASDGVAGGPLVEIGPPIESDGVAYGFGFSPDGQQVVLTIGPTTQIYSAIDGTPVGDPMTIGALPSYQRIGALIDASLARAAGSP